MLQSLILSEHNLYIVDFSKIFTDRFLPNFYSSCEQYNLHNISLKNKDVKKLIYHCLIHSLCEEVLCVKSNNKTVIFYNTNHLPKSDLTKYISEEELIIFIELLLRKTSKMLPIRVFITSYTFDYFVHLIKAKKARGIEILYKIKAFVDKISFEKFTFQKIRLFSKKYDLTFLSNIYFNAIKSKQLLLK
jgi:hypothetical protein